MRAVLRRISLVVLGMIAGTVPALAQVAATVNGQPIAEAAVQRGLKRVPPAEIAKARAEILAFLIDNAILDQYLVAQKITVAPAELDARLTEIQAEIAKHKQDYAKMLKELNLTEAELKEQVAADLRWEKFANARATPDELTKLYAANTAMFDGTMVRARHILIVPTAADQPTIDGVRAKLNAIKTAAEQAAAAAVANLPAGSDPLTIEQARNHAIDAAFAKAAGESSACPSGKDGGDVSWFPRAGSMVEPFAAAAFALKPFEISEPIATPFGFHLILCTGRRPGQPTTFETVKDEVKEVYCGRIREQLLAQLRPSAKVEIHPAPAGK